MYVANLGTVVTNTFLKFPWHMHDGGPQQVTSVYNQPVSYRMWEEGREPHS